ncbi:DUF4136 domain-containing protein [Pseudoxanthomonas kalamensis]|uniref:DUF4136 domain-containing protein n=1 Tax=Pseudoxanthomonas kalamensis TaxID=289483 RepID=UPI001391B03D|nr:DUF4136 domain-containing protein [Pseudoxanthomonas kalamensis]
MSARAGLRFGGAGLMLALGLAACSSTSPTVSSLPPPEVKVVKPAGTLPGPGYAWLEMPPQQVAEQDARVNDPQFRARLQAALDKALQAKGYQPAAAGSADFIIAYRVGVRDVQDAQAVGSDVVAGTPQAAVKCTSGGCSQIVAEAEDGQPLLKVVSHDYVQGGLLVEVLEPRSVRLLWSASNTGMVMQGDGSQERLDRIAASTLKSLPAAPK